MSIRQRLTLYWAAVLAVILVVAACAVILIFSREQWAALDAALLEEADTGAAAISQAQAAGAGSIVQRLSRERDLGPRKRVRLMAGGDLIADSGDPGADLPALSDNAAHGKVVDGGRGVYRFAVMPLSIGGRGALLLDGVDAAPVRASIARLRAIVMLGAPFLLLLCVGGGYWLARRSLDPISSLAAELARIDPDNLGQRIAVGPQRDELFRLTAAINSLLERVEHASLVERRFVSDAAHELRTPLAILRTGLEVALNRERAADELRDAIRAALREVTALCATAEELLTMARLGVDDAARREPIDLSELTGQVLEAVEPLIDSKHLTLAARCDPVVVEGNRDHLRRVLINLIDNAVKYTPQAGRIGVVLRHDGDCAWLEISDSGPGIAASDLPYIFERFFRGAGQNGCGGLGLSLAREIVRLHKGSISVRNLPGGGSEFMVSLPLKQV